VKKAKKPTDQLRAYLRESIAVLSKYRMNYARLFSELDALPAKQREEVQSAERSILELLRSTLVAINPALADNTKVTPVTLLALGTMVWSYTWYDPKRALSLDELVELTTRFVISGLDGVTGDGK
jgi:hypothetical protein